MTAVEQELCEAELMTRTLWTTTMDDDMSVRVEARLKARHNAATEARRVKLEKSMAIDQEVEAYYAARKDERDACC